jgi:hypothetical protein
MTEHDLARIAKVALRELGAGDVEITVAPEPGVDRWRLTVLGGQQQFSLRIRAGDGTTAQYVREQIFEQFERR